MKIRAAIAFGFPMKIPVLDIKAHRQAHVGIGGQLFTGRAPGAGAAEMKHRRIFPPTISARNSISTVRPSPALATKFHTAGGPISNDARF